MEEVLIYHCLAFNWALMLQSAALVNVSGRVLYINTSRLTPDLRTPGLSLVPSPSGR